MADPIDARGLMTDRGIGRYVLNPAAVIGIADHHSVTGGQFFAGVDLGQDEELSHLIMIDQYHASLGWGGFAYHLAEFPSGRRYLCGNLTGARAHVASRNNELIGHVLIGDFTSSPPGPAQLVAAALDVDYIRRTYPGRPHRPHRDWALPEHRTACPGDTYQSWISQLDQPPQEDDMFEPADRQVLTQLATTLARIEPAVNRQQRLFVRQDGRDQVYQLTDAQTLVHITGPAQLGVQADDVVVLPAAHPLFRLATTFPAGVPFS